LHKQGHDGTANSRTTQANCEDNMQDLCHSASAQRIDKRFRSKSFRSIRSMRYSGILGRFGGPVHGRSFGVSITR